MLVGTRYAAATIDSYYDVIVVGSGLGGLSTAALLSKAGKKVLVLERHYTAGGFTHSYRRRGFEWDVGVHYVGEVHNPASRLRRIFDAITDSQLQWARMDDTYDRVVIHDDSYDFVAGAAAFRDELARSFPHARAEIDEYLRHIRAASASLPAHFGPRYLPGPLRRVVGGVAARVGTDYFSRTTRSVMSDIVSDPRLAAVLTGQWGDYGLPPGQSSFAMHAIVAQHYLGGASFPVGGASQIARTIVPTIERGGGSVVVNAEVDQIVVAKNRAVGVRLSNGHEIRADRVVSDVGLRTTFGRLVPPEAGTRSTMPAQVAGLRPAAAHVGLYVGLHGTTADLGLSQTNLWLYPSDDHDANVATYLSAPSTDLPLSYLSFPSAKDPSWSSRYPGRSTIDVITLAPHEWFATWKDEPWRRRGAQYDELKAQFAERMLDDVYAHVPKARGNVAYHELSTPLSTTEFAGYRTGEIYGIEHSPQRFAQTWIKPSTPIGGLYLTGQDVLFCGVGSALMSGVVTAASVLGPALLRQAPGIIDFVRA
ncbi:MAG: NAD(P)/FAD-dependent oxidoreductase [Jiangellales bacterium]